MQMEKCPNCQKDFDTRFVSSTLNGFCSSKCQSENSQKNQAISQNSGSPQNLNRGISNTNQGAIPMEQQLLVPTADPSTLLAQLTFASQQLQAFQERSRQLDREVNLLREENRKLDIKCNTLEQKKDLEKQQALLDQASETKGTLDGLMENPEGVKPILEGIATVIEAWKTGSDKSTKPEQVEGQLVGFENATDQTKTYLDTIVSVLKQKADDPIYIGSVLNYLMLSTYSMEEFGTISSTIYEMVKKYQDTNS